MYVPVAAVVEAEAAAGCRNLDRTFRELPLLPLPYLSRRPSVFCGIKAEAAT